MRYAKGVNSIQSSVIGSEEEGERHISLYNESGNLVFDGGSESVDLYLVEDAEQFGRFVSLHRRENSAIIENKKHASMANDAA